MWRRLRCFLPSVAAADVAAGAEMKFLNASTAYTLQSDSEAGGGGGGGGACCSVSVTERRV